MQPIAKIARMNFSLSHLGVNCYQKSFIKYGVGLRSHINQSASDGLIFCLY